MIRKDQTDKKRYRNSIYYASKARVGFRFLLRNMSITKDEYILLPSYVGYSIREGSGVHDPIEECEINYTFYRVDKNLSCDLDDLRNKISSFKIFAVFVIHYFGFKQSDIIEIKNICQHNNVYLIEDCAHCLNSSSEGTPLGDYGDFSLFSLPKTLPVPDGGILQVNRGDIALPPISTVDKISLEAMEIYSTSDIEAITNQRIKNYNALLELLLPMSGIEILYPKLPTGIVPMNFPVLLRSKNRHETFEGLMNEGVETMALYYQLIDPIQEAEYPVSHEISRKILNLPIHQDVSAGDIRIIADKLTKVLR